MQYLSWLQVAESEPWRRLLHRWSHPPSSWPHPVQNVHSCSPSVHLHCVCVCVRMCVCICVCVEEKRKRWTSFEECEVELEEVRRLWPWVWELKKPFTLTTGGDHYTPQKEMGKPRPWASLLFTHLWSLPPVAPTAESVQPHLTGGVWGERGMHAHACIGTSTQEDTFPGHIESCTNMA